MGWSTSSNGTCKDPNAGLFGGLIVGAMVGPTYSIYNTVALGIIDKRR
ncbi:hypothetical protein Q5M85_03175 [Paraclostridium bifermentans]|nr:hypothetical protein [Paraclostridium bifermentans]